MENIGGNMWIDHPRSRIGRIVRVETKCQKAQNKVRKERKGVGGGVLRVRAHSRETERETV